MRMGTGIAMAVALTGILALATAGAEEPAPAAKVYLSMAPTTVDVEFKPLLEYTPATVNGNRTALEAYVAEAARPAAEALTAEARQAIEASLDGQATVVDSPLAGRSDTKTFGAALAALPFMQRRGVPVTVVVSEITLAGDHEGTVVNPRPYQRPGGPSDGSLSGAWANLKSAGRSLANITQGNTPLTFDGLTHVSYRLRYQVYATANGELLREGEVGPLTVDSARWQGSWSFPEVFLRSACTAGGVCEHVTDPRPAILPEVISQMAPQIKETVTKSFSDWNDLIAAGQELAAKR